MICHTPEPKNRTNTSPTSTPTATPMAISTPRRIRWPKVTPRVMIAATGAKNGIWWPSRCSATNQARPAVTAVCRIRNQRDRQRSTRRTASPGPRRAVRPLRSYARSVICHNAVPAGVPSFRIGGVVGKSWSVTAPSLRPAAAEDLNQPRG